MVKKRKVVVTARDKADDLRYGRQTERDNDECRRLRVIMTRRTSQRPREKRNKRRPGSIDGRVGSAADVEVCGRRRDRRAFTDEPSRNTCLDGFGEYRVKKGKGD